MASTALLGSTGMVGSHILSNLLSSPKISSIEVLARRNPLSSSSAAAKLTVFIEADTTKWVPYYKNIPSTPSVIISALATTKAAAGSFGTQYKIEHDLNIEMAKTARNMGSKVYVLISSAGASTTAMFAYQKMKGQIEDDIKALDFDTTIILRPGLIAGYREESRPAEAVFRKIADGLGMINSNYLKDGWAQDAEVIAKAAVVAALEALEGKAPGKVWILTGRDIIQRAKTE